MHQGASRKEAKAKAIEMLELVGHPGGRVAGERLPAPVLRRHAPARDDRHGAVAQARRDHRRRADHGARRDRPGAGDAAARRPAAGDEARPDPDHPRHGRGRRRRRQDLCHVRRQRRRAGRRLPDLRDAGPPLHEGAARVDPARRPEGAAADRHQGPAPRAGQPAAGLLLPPAVHLCAATSARPTSRSSTPSPAVASARATTGRRSWASDDRNRTEHRAGDHGQRPRRRARGHATSRSTSRSRRESSSSAPSATSRPSTASPSSSTRARPWAWWASPAVASPRSAGCCWAWRSRPRDRSSCWVAR